MLSHSTSCGLMAACAGLLFAGCDQTTALAPGQDPTGIAPELAGGSVGQVTPVHRFSDLGVVGTSRAVRTAGGISYTLRTDEVEPGHAFTLWLVIFNHPEHCQNPTPVSLCNLPDLEDPDVRGDVVFAGAGQIIGATGKANFAGHRSLGDNGGSIFAPVGLPAPGLENPLGAEFHLAVHDHGVMNPAYMPDMVRTIGGGCASPGTGSPLDDLDPRPAEYGRADPQNVGYCVSIQFAVYQP